jgi:WD40 repeat protein
VLAVDFNYFGTRMVTASSDHRLKVWDKKDDSWTLVESWKAHDAEIVDVSVLSDLQPHASIGLHAYGIATKVTYC